MPPGKPAAGLDRGAEGENPSGELKNEDKSHDVVENTWRKNVHLGVSHDVYENKGTYWDEATMLLKIKALTAHRQVRRGRSPRFLFLAHIFGLPPAGTATLECPRHARSTPSILIKLGSNLRRLWGITQASANPGGALGVKSIKKFSDRSEDVIENKRPRDIMPEKESDFVSEIAEIYRILYEF